MTSRLLSLQDVAAARAFYAAGHWRDETMYGLLVLHAQARPDAVALVDGAGAIGWGELLEWVETYAASLEEAGLRPGDRVAIWSPSRMESVIALLACSRAGYVCVPSFHRDHTPDNVLQLLARTRAAAFVYQEGYGSNPAGTDLEAGLARLHHLKHVRRLEPLRADAGPAFPRFGGMEKRRRQTAREPDANPDRIMYLAFTSGTTGQPKGVMHSDNTLLSNGRAIARDFGFDEETVVYTLSPMSHNMGTVSLAVALSCGGALVVHGPLDNSRLLQRIRATGATYLVGVPTHGIDLVAQLAPGEPLGQVGCFQLAGSPVPARLAEALLARGVTVQNCFGMTENCSFLYTFPEDGIEVVTTTCGHCADGMEIAIVDAEDSDRRLGRGEQGEIAIRGASMMLGYFDDQAATEASFNRDGWFLSGDLGMLDDDGNYRVVGRKKDLIIRGGHNIHPAEVEALAIRHPAVGKVAAFPVPDERLGEKMCLAALLQQDARLEAGDMLAHLHAQGLSTYDMPEYFIVMEEFPLTASGKILKRELAAMARDGRIAPAPVRWSGG